MGRNLDPCAPPDVKTYIVNPLTVLFIQQGGFKSGLAFTEAEGNPILLSLCGSFLAVATDKGYIKLYDVSKRAKTDASTLPVSSRHGAVLLFIVLALLFRSSRF